MAECNGKVGCPVHRNLRTNHPTKPVSVRLSDGQTVAHDYSDQWDAAEAEWQRVSQSPEGRAALDSIHDALGDA